MSPLPRPAIVDGPWGSVSSPASTQLKAMFTEPSKFRLYERHPWLSMEECKSIDQFRGAQMNRESRLLCGDEQSGPSGRGGMWSVGGRIAAFLHVPGEAVELES